MLIDWFTVIAQVVNFLILLWLLKRFLYRPILDAIDMREKRIAMKLADADAKKEEAQQERDTFKYKNDEFDRQRSALMNQAIEEANAERQRLLDEVRKSADALRAKRQEILRSDAHNLNRAIGNRIRQEVFAIARKVLADLASLSLEQRLTEVFIQRLQDMEVQAKANLSGTLSTASTVQVKSAFDLPEAHRAAIRQALNETFPAAAQLIRFETAPDLIGGIELSVNGQKVTWSISDYLWSLEKSVNELLKEQDKVENGR